MPKIAEMKLSSCGLEVAEIRKNCDGGIVELRLRSNIALKSCGIAIADLQNLTSAIPQLSTVSCQFRYVLVPVPQLRMAFKINQNYF